MEKGHPEGGHKTPIPSRLGSMGTNVPIVLKKGDIRKLGSIH